MHDPEVFDRAIAAHAKWKYRLMEAIETGQSEWKIAKVRSDSQCDFGTWLANLPLTERLAGPLQKVRTLHAEFHALAADILEMAISQRKDDALAAMAPRSRFATVSSSLTLAVLDWKKASEE
jgi:hypothetical protein